MADINYKLSYIAELKGCTIEELCQLAQEKGITIPCDPSYMLSPSLLNTIDPKLAWDIKYNKMTSVKDNNPKIHSNKKSEVGQQQDLGQKRAQVKKPEMKIIGKIDLSNGLSSFQESNSRNATNSEKIVSVDRNKTIKEVQRVIGIVKFFDLNKGFGFIVTGCKGITKKVEEEKVFSIHFTKSDWRSLIYPISRSRAKTTFRTSHGKTCSATV